MCLNCVEHFLFFSEKNGFETLFFITRFNSFWNFRLFKNFKDQQVYQDFPPWVPGTWYCEDKQARQAATCHATSFRALSGTFSLSFRSLWRLSFKVLVRCLSQKINWPLHVDCCPISAPFSLSFRAPPSSLASFLRTSKSSNRSSPKPLPFQAPLRSPCRSSLWNLPIKAPLSSFLSFVLPQRG